MSCIPQECTSTPRRVHSSPASHDSCSNMHWTMNTTMYCWHALYLGASIDVTPEQGLPLMTTGFCADRCFLSWPCTCARTSSLPGLSWPPWWGCKWAYRFKHS